MIALALVMASMALAQVFSLAQTGGKNQVSDKGGFAGKDSSSHRCREPCYQSRWQKGACLVLEAKGNCTGSLRRKHLASVGGEHSEL